ncbi:PE family protein [Mycobacterium tuberculosis]|uniref:PE family protein n=1 Tax=Mycobacterium tuberculosis TaxID=1773 RepID=UPI000A561698|nr:PE family protein [Mycobacterium tuberculosis]
MSGIHDLWLADSKTAITVVNAIVPPAADPVSNRMVGRILEHMAQYQQISSQALEYLRGFSRERRGVSARRSPKQHNLRLI